MENLKLTLTDKIMKILEDIYFSNNTAIYIPNNLLQYENKFKLEFKVFPFRSILQQRLHPYVFIAAKKNVRVDVIDEVGLSEFYKSPHSRSFIDIESVISIPISPENSSMMSSQLGIPLKWLVL